MNQAEYLYCLVDADGPLDFESPSPGPVGEPVGVLGADGMGVLVSRCSPDGCDMSRSNLLNHQRVMESAMERFTVLPIRFGTIAAGDSQEDVETLIRTRLLANRQAEIEQLFARMAGKQEWSLRVLWKDPSAVLSNLAATDPEVRRMTARAERGRNPNRAELIQIGSLVQERLYAHREQLALDLVARLAPGGAEAVRHDPLGDRMVLNGAFLVESAQRDTFLTHVEAAVTEHPELAFRCFGPMPPCSFVNLVVSWE